MNTAVRRGAIVVLLVLAAACGKSGPTSPTGVGQPTALPAPTPTPTPPPATNFPPLSGPARTFVFDPESSPGVRDYTRDSRLALYDNGACVFQYVGSGLEYKGRYTEANGVMAFDFGFTNLVPGPGASNATGTLNGDSLTVIYGYYMSLYGFDDAVYVLMR